MAGGQARESDADYIYAKAGLQRDWVSFDRTHLSLDYYSGEDFAFAGSDSESLGLAVVQKVDTYNLEVYASYRTYDFNSAGSSNQDVDVTIIGARWKF